MAFEELHRPLFREHGVIHFSNGKKPSQGFNYAFCEVCVSFTAYMFVICSKQVQNLWRLLHVPTQMSTCSLANEFARAITHTYDCAS